MSGSAVFWRNMCKGFRANPEIVAAYVYDVKDDDGCIVAKTGLDERANNSPHMVDYLAGFILAKEIQMRGELFKRVKSGAVRAGHAKASYTYNIYYTDTVLTTPTSIYIIGRIGSTLFIAVWEALPGLEEKA